MASTKSSNPFRFLEKIFCLKIGQDEPSSGT